MKKKLVDMNLLKKVFKKFFKISFIKKNYLFSFFNDKIILADIGSTGGIEERWQALLGFVLLLFDYVVSDVPKHIDMCLF